MKKIFILIASVSSFSTMAQDFHYTHFYQSPFVINPALAGVYVGDVRVINNYRTQWSTVTSYPYQSETFSVDAPVLRSLMSGKDHFNVGLAFNNDVAGLSKMTTNLYEGAIGFTKSLSDKITNSVSLAFMSGFGTHRLDLTALAWDSQYGPNGYDPTLASGEPVAGAIQKTYVDFSSGLLWDFAPTDQVKLKLGLAGFHLNEPEYAFVGSEKLYRKFVSHAMADIKLGTTTNISMQPAFEYALQGPTTLINVGTNFKYVLQDRSKYTGVYSEVALSFGGWYRVGDAMMFTGRLDYGQFALGVSYDSNLSGLTAASNGKGGFELLFVYTGVFKGGATVKLNKSRI